MDLYLINFRKNRSEKLRKVRWWGNREAQKTQKIICDVYMLNG